MQRQKPDNTQILRQEQVAVGLDAIRHQSLDPNQLIPKATNRKKMLPDRLEGLKPVQENKQRTEPRRLSELETFHQLHHKTRHQLHHSACLASQAAKNRRVMVDQPRQLFQVPLRNVDIENPDHNHGDKQAAVFIFSQEGVHVLRASLEQELQVLSVDSGQEDPLDPEERETKRDMPNRLVGDFGHRGVLFPFKS